MKTITFLSGVVLLGLSALGAHAQQIAVPDKFGAWSKVSCSDAPLASTISQEAGEKGGVTSCRFAAGSNTIEVAAEEFRDPSSAYEVYTSRLHPGMSPSTVTQLTAVENGELIALVGSRVVSVSPIRVASDVELKSLLDKLKQSADQSPLPPIRGYLPDVDMVQGTQRYALGPAGFDAALVSLNQAKFSAITPEMGFNKGAEAMLAGYHSASGKTETLILVEYPTPQLAEQQLKHIQPILSSHADFGGATVERKNSLLSLVLSPASVQSAASLRENIKYEIAVTWNEGSHTLTDPPWVVVLKNIFLGTLAFCGLALALGLAFGGLRVVTKRFLPGKVFDRAEDMEVLQLGLSSKRIDPRDFY